MRKRERVEATLRHESVDRAALLEQLSYNPGVIAMYTGKSISGFDYGEEDIAVVIRATMDMAMPFNPPFGTGRRTTEDGFVFQNDNWTSWRVSRPFDDVEGARDWLIARTESITEAPVDAETERTGYHGWMKAMQQKFGETVILGISGTGFCHAFDRMGLELFTYFVVDYPEVFDAYMQASAGRERERVLAVADVELSPVILIAEDFSASHGPIFSPKFLKQYHYPHVAQVAEAWHEHGVHVLYHSDGHYKPAIPDLMAAGVDGFYCLEPGCGMDIVELKQRWPEMVWAGGVDGVDLMERGTPEEVKAEVRRHIFETDALNTGGMFVASSSEINPPILPENFRAMVEAVGEVVNEESASQGDR